MTNSSLSMTKESYYEMCEMLGTEPDPEEVPVEFEDLPLEVQEAYNIYGMLQGTYSSVSGEYMGKSYAGIIDILTLYEVEDKVTMFKLIKEIDRIVIEVSRQKTKQPTPK